MKLSRKIKFWLLILGLLVIATVMLLMAEPKLPGIGDFFNNAFFGILSVSLYTVIVIMLFIVFFSAKFLGIHFLRKKEKKTEKKSEKKTQATETKDQEESE